MQTEDIPVFVYLIIVALGHYTFSMQRVTYNLAKEFNITQDFFNVLLPVWFVPCQWVLTIVKYSLLLYIFSIAMAKEGFGIGLFQVLILFFGAAFVHIFWPLFPARWFFQMLYNNAKCIRDIYDYSLGSHYMRLLRLSRLF